MIQSIDIYQQYNTYNIPFAYSNPVFRATKGKNISSTTRIKYLTKRLEDVLYSQTKVDCLSNYKQFVPKDASPAKKIKTLEFLFQCSKFFSRMSLCEKRFGKNFDFAIMANNLFEKVTKLINEGINLENILKQIEPDYTNNTDKYREKRLFYHTGYRGVSAGNDPSDDAITPFDKDTYGENYHKRFTDNINNRIPPHYGFIPTKIFMYTSWQGRLQHPNSEQVDNNMKIVSVRYKIFQSIVEKYQKTKVLNASEREQADKIIAEMYYLMANTCPFHHGTNGICDILMRGQYAALGINKPHIKYGVSLDLEAFCMNLDEYKLEWKNFFED